LTVITLLGFVLTGCGPPAKKEDLYVAAASDLVRALPDLCQDFRGRTSVTCRISFGSSGMLAQQIEHGAPFGVFLSADRAYVEQLARTGKVAGGRRVYARGRLVLWSRDLAIGKLEDLRGPGVKRIALANPSHAPYGRAAQQALERAGLWTALQPKIVLADTVRHSLDMAETGNVDAAFAALSLIASGSGHSWLVPEDQHAPLDQEAAVVAASQDAERFLAYLATAPAQKILTQYGFLLPK